MNKIYKVLTHPNAIINYIQRSKNLKKILPESKSEINTFLREANNVTKEFEAFAKSQNFIGVRLLDCSVLYTIVRALKPKTIVETGVSNGVSSRCILEALKRNEYGTLYSIDLPIEISLAVIHPNKEIGWVVPNRLKQRWKLIFGDSKVLLSKVLSEHSEIDIFLHDSYHTYDFMTFEFKLAWKYLSDKGILLSHDINVNDAFEDFKKEVNPAYTTTFGILGAMRK